VSGARDPIERLIHCAAAAAWIVTAYFVISLVLSSTLHLPPSLFGLPPQPGIRIGDWAAWLSITAGLYSRSKSRDARSIPIKREETP
jgi:hypothetical protein